MYGDKSLPEWNTGTGPKGQLIPKHSVNLSFYVTREEFEKMLYQERLPYREIVERIEYPYDLSNFSRIVRRLGWKRETGPINNYEVDADVFCKWERNTAWMYGWIITDGHVSDKYVGVRLQSADIDVVEKIKKHAKFSGPLYEYPGKCEVRMYSPIMVRSLRSLGIPKRGKTFDCEYPESLPAHLQWDFIRGAFEGDGCVSTGLTNNLQVSFCGASENFLTKMGDQLRSQGINVRVSRTGSVFVLTASSISDGLCWLLYMYRNTDASIRMDRKFNKFVEFVRTYYDRKRKSPEAAELIELIRKSIPECAVTTQTPELLAA